MRRYAVSLGPVIEPTAEGSLHPLRGNLQPRPAPQNRGERTMSRTGSNGFTGIGRWFAVVFAILLSGIALAPVQASADDCVALGGTLGAECVISGAVAGARTGTFTLNETLRFTSGGKLTTAPPTGIVINITAGDFIMQNNTTIDGSSATFGAPIKVQLTSGNIDLQTGSQVLSNGLVGGFIQLISGPTATVD